MVGPKNQKAKKKLYNIFFNIMQANSSEISLNTFLKKVMIYILGWSHFFFICSYDETCLVVPEKARNFGL